MRRWRRSARTRAGSLALLLALSACTATPPPSASLQMSAGPSTSIEATPSLPIAYPFPLEATIPELQAAMESGELTAVELVDFYLARIAAYDDLGPALNAFILVNPAARDEAAALDAERATSGPRGPLHGIPIVIKDNIGTADMPTTAGSRALEGFIPSDDAFQVRKLREAGAIIIGKTNLCEFALCWETTSSLGGQTRNPYDPTRDPGGSSGGTAVAVAANFGVAGLGTDTCGSIRLPSGLNDLYGLRPTNGLSSRAGVIPFSTSTDTVGPMARSVIDLAIVLDATAGEDPADPTTVPLTTSFADAVDPNGLAGRRIGLLTFTLDPEMMQLEGGAIDAMVANGVEVTPVNLPAGVRMDPLYGELRTALDAYLAAQPTAPVRSLAEIANSNVADPWVAGFLRSLASAPNLDSQAYRDAVDGRATFRDKVVALMDEHDLDAIAYPESRRPAALIGAGQEAFNCDTAAYGGLPAIVIPAGLTADGLPVGLELMGRPFDEATLIAIAAGFEAHTGPRVLPPSTPPL